MRRESILSYLKKIESVVLWISDKTWSKCSENFSLYSPHVFKKNGSLISFSNQSDCFWWKSYTNKPMQPHWSQQHLQPHWPHQPLKPYFLKELPDPDGWIIPGTKMTNTGPFLWNGSSKIQIFTNIWNFFCQRLLRPSDATFLKTGWWKTNE